MIQKQIKKYKLDQIQKIKQTAKYIYIYRYNNLNINENILLKKQIKKINYQSLVLKQNLINKYFLNIGGQGSILIIYGNNNINLLENFIQFKKIKLIYLIANNVIYSNLKLAKILYNNNVSLNFLIVKPFLHFLYYLRKI
jgi:ribosomal protein L10